MGEKRAHILHIHVGLFSAEVICLSAFTLELSRALSGNTLSWAYVIEWPILGAYAVYMWRRLLRDERAEHENTDAPALAHDARSDDEHDDPRLAQWNEYLARVHAEEGPTTKNP